MKIRRRLGRILRDLGYPNAELSLLFTDDNRITDLNRRYLKRHGPTNVIAFPMTDVPQAELEPLVLGDIVISLDAAERDAQVCEESLEETVYLLLIHGLLHLLGYDHEKSEQEAQRMEKETERLLALIKSPDSNLRTK